MRFAVPAIAIGILLAACGGGDSPFDQPQPSPTVGGLSQTPVPQSTLPSSAASATPCVTADYAVQEGDTLLSVAINFDTTVEAIVEASQLEDPDVLSIGQALKIPCPPAITPTPIGTGEEDEASPTSSGSGA